MATQAKGKPQNPPLKALDSFIRRILDYKPPKKRKK